MVRLFPPAALVVALIASPSCAPPVAPTDEPTLAAELAAAETGASALVREWATTTSEGRWDDLPGLFADDAVWIEQGELRYNGRMAIEEGARSASAAGVAVQTSVDNVVSTALSPDAASVRAEVKIQGDAHGGFEFDGVLSGTAVNLDGDWVFLEGHLSQPMRAPNGAVRARLAARREAAAVMSPEERAQRREEIRRQRLENIRASGAR